MKKTIMTFAFMLAVLAVNAQTLIKVNLQKGDKATYAQEVNANISSPMGGGAEHVKTTSNLTVEVVDANAEGYKVDFLTTDMKIEGNKDVAEQVGDQTLRFINNVKLSYQTDKNGELKKLLNYEEVVAKMSKAAITAIDSAYKAKPELEKAVPKMNVIMALNDVFTEKNITERFKDYTVFALYGKTLKSGDKEQKDVQGIKTIVTYELNNILGMQTVVGKSKGDMEEKDVKAFIINNMKRMGVGDDAVSQLENNWGQMKAMGMTNFDFSGTDTYHLQKNGWVNDIASAAKTKFMGMELKIESSSKLINHSWK